MTAEDPKPKKKRDTRAEVRDRMLAKVPDKEISDADRQALSVIAASLSASHYLSSLGYTLFPWQKAVLDDFSRRICINGARQAGKSTILAGTVCHRAKYYPKSLCIILTPSLKQSNEDMEKVNQFIAMDPAYPKLIKNNSEVIELANGSRILVLTASEDAARGFSNPDIILFDEASRIPDEVFGAVRPMITNNRKARIYEISTPNGKKGFFYYHFTNKSWSRYIVRGAWDVVQTGSLPALVDTTYQPPVEYKYFISPRHLDHEEQMEALDDMHYDVRNYRQEYCCEFVDAEDQVFAQELIEQMFGSPVPAADRSRESSIFAVAEPDLAFEEDMSRWMV